MQPHEYSIVGHNRAAVGRYIWVTASALASAFAALSPYIQAIFHRMGLSPLKGSLIGFPITATTIYAIGYYTFDKYLWKWPLLSKALKVPNLEGKWLCQGARITEGDGDPNWAGEIIITQTWEKIRVYLETKNSTSKSVSASLIKEPGRGYILMYSYRNEPKMSKVKIAPHIGYCELNLKENGNEAEGFYFNNLGRVTAGNIKLVKN